MLLSISMPYSTSYYTFVLIVSLIGTRKSRDSSVGIALGYGLTIGVIGFDSRLRLGIFLFTIVSRMALRPT
jgi:hypothetical protein